MRLKEWWKWHFADRIKWYLRNRYGKMSFFEWLSVQRTCVCAFGSKLVAFIPLPIIIWERHVSESHACCFVRLEAGMYIQRTNGRKDHEGPANKQSWYATAERITNLTTIRSEFPPEIFALFQIDCHTCQKRLAITYCVGVSPRSRWISSVLNAWCLVLGALRSGHVFMYFLRCLPTLQVPIESRIMKSRV